MERPKPVVFNGMSSFAGLRGLGIEGELSGELGARGGADGRS